MSRQSRAVGDRDTELGVPRAGLHSVNRYAADANNNHHSDRLRQVISIQRLQLRFLMGSNDIPKWQ